MITTWLGITAEDIKRYQRQSEADEILTDALDLAAEEFRNDGDSRSRWRTASYDEAKFLAYLNERLPSGIDPFVLSQEAEDNKERIAELRSVLGEVHKCLNRKFKHPIGSDLHDFEQTERWDKLYDIINDAEDLL